MNKTFPLHEPFISTKPSARVTEMTSRGEDVHADFVVMEKLFWKQGEKAECEKKSISGGGRNEGLYSNGTTTESVRGLKAYFLQNMFTQLLRVSSWGIPAVWDISHRQISWLVLKLLGEKVISSLQWLLLDYPSGQSEMAKLYCLILPCKIGIRLNHLGWS